MLPTGRSLSPQFQDTTQTAAPTAPAAAAAAAAAAVSKNDSETTINSTAGSTSTSSLHKRSRDNRDDTASESSPSRPSKVARNILDDVSSTASKIDSAVSSSPTPQETVLSNGALPTLPGSLRIQPIEGTYIPLPVDPAIGAAGGAAAAAAGGAAVGEAAAAAARATSTTKTYAYYQFPEIAIPSDVLMNKFLNRAMSSEQVLSHVAQHQEQYTAMEITEIQQIISSTPLQTVSEESSKFRFSSTSEKNAFDSRTVNQIRKVTQFYMDFVSSLMIDIESDESKNEARQIVSEALRQVQNLNNKTNREHDRSYSGSLLSSLSSSSSSSSRSSGSSSSRNLGSSSSTTPGSASSNSSSSSSGGSSSTPPGSASSNISTTIVPRGNF